MFKAIKLNGTSMRPFFKDGDIVFYDDDFNKIRLGDMIVYVYDNNKYLHRVVGFNEDKILVSNDDDMSVHVIRKTDILGRSKSFFNGYIGYLVHIFMKKLRLLKKFIK